MYKWETKIDDLLQKLVVIVVEIAILAIICVSLFSGKPAFRTSATTYNPLQPVAGLEFRIVRSPY